MKYSSIINTTTEIVRLSRAVLFHEYYGDDALTLATEERLLHDTLVKGMILSAEDADLFIQNLDEIRNSLQTDVEAAYNGDPAAKSYDEIICCYP